MLRKFECRRCGSVFDIQDSSISITVACPNSGCGGAAVLLADPDSGLMTLDSQAGIVPEFNSREHFSFFTCQRLLARFPFSPADIKLGIVEEKYRHGIDALYLVIEGRMIRTMQDVTWALRLPGGAKVDLIFIRATREADYKAKRIQALRDLIQTSMESGPAGASTDPFDTVHWTIEQFLEISREFSNRSPRIRIGFFYVTRGNPAELKAEVQAEADALKKLTKSLLPHHGSVEVGFINESELAA